MNKFIRNNLNIALGSLVVVDGQHRSAELATMYEFNEYIYRVVLIDRDESGEYVEIEEHCLITSTDRALSASDMPDCESFFRHSLSLVDAPRPLEIDNCNVGKMCVIGKMLNHLPYIEEYGERLYYSDTLKINDSNLDKRLASNIVFKIIKVEDGLVQILSLTHNIVMILPPYVLYEFSPSSLYIPKLLTRD